MMAFTTISIMSLLLNIIFLTAMAFILKRYFDQRKQLKDVVKELESDSLEHYLKKIRDRGFDVTVKPKKK